MTHPLAGKWALEVGKADALVLFVIDIKTRRVPVAGVRVEAECTVEGTLVDVPIDDRPPNRDPKGIGDEEKPDLAARKCRAVARDFRVLRVDTFLYEGLEMPQRGLGSANREPRPDVDGFQVRHRGLAEIRAHAGPRGRGLERRHAVDSRENDAFEPGVEVLRLRNAEHGFGALDARSYDGWQR